MVERVPLFLTQLSLRPITGPAVQTRLYADNFPDWLHFHWEKDEAEELRDRSIKLESGVLGLWPWRRGQRFYKRMARRAGLSWWRGDRLRPAIARRLLKTYGGRVGPIYASPMMHHHFSRMRHLVELFDQPFVVHVWDFLDGGMELTGEDTYWLLRNAARVFALPGPIYDELAAVRPDTEIVSFTRPPTPHRASPPEGRLLRVALIGHLQSYREGLEFLDAAIDLVECEGLGVEVIYIGPPSNLDAAETTLAKRVQRLGFVPDDDARDVALASAHVAFLSGPLSSPEQDARSRYSIPSRTLDFKAVGLPMLATVHPESATAAFLSSFDPNATRLCASPEDIAQSLMDLADTQTWRAAHEQALAEFDRYRSLEPEKVVREALVQLATPPTAARV